MKSIKLTFKLVMLAINSIMVLIIREATDKSISELQADLESQTK